MRTLLFIFLLAPCLLLAQAGRKVSDNYTVPMNYTVANDCTGEAILLNGTMHAQYNARETADGWRAESMSNYQGVSAVGQTSGRKYRMVGASQTNVDFRRPFPAHNTVVQTVRLISQDGTPNSHYKLHWHYTINAEGKVTAQFERVEVECRGQRK